MQIYVNILILTLIGGVTAFLARERGRDPIFWFFIGILFSIFGLITLLVLPKVALDSENNRTDKIDLKNQSSQDSTSETLLSLPVLDPLGISPSTKHLALDQWFYMDRYWQVSGPWDLAELARQWKQGHIPVETFFWNPHLEQWSSINQIEGLKQRLEAPEALN